MTDTPAPVAQPLSAAALRKALRVKRVHDDGAGHPTITFAMLTDEEWATLDAARSVPDNADPACPLNWRAPEEAS